MEFEPKSRQFGGFSFDREHPRGGVRGRFCPLDPADDCIMKGWGVTDGWKSGWIDLPPDGGQDDRTKPLLNKSLKITGMESIVAYYLNLFSLETYEAFSKSERNTSDVRIRQKNAAGRGEVFGLCAEGMIV